MEGTLAKHEPYPRPGELRVASRHDSFISWVGNLLKSAPTTILFRNRVGAMQLTTLFSISYLVPIQNKCHLSVESMIFPIENWATARASDTTANETTPFGSRRLLVPPAHQQVGAVAAIQPQLKEFRTGLLRREGRGGDGRQAGGRQRRIP